MLSSPCLTVGRMDFDITPLFARPGPAVLEKP
jgi:hypothetical protein